LTLIDERLPQQGALLADPTGKYHTVYLSIQLDVVIPYVTKDAVNKDIKSKFMRLCWGVGHSNLGKVGRSRKRFPSRLFVENLLGLE
jgi:hypothetical protein